ncbi:hypothetical protein Ancab_034167 [Ancistrocladus abbreviatus]
MSASRGGGGGGNNVVNGKGNMNNITNNNGVASIPVASKKMVQSLKEIVNCPELEIYAMLKECNMDPNEAVNRLLSQDPFHEVKSKREKKKEIKDVTESKPRSGLNRGSRGGADRYVGRGGAPHLVSAESAALHGKPTLKKDNGATAHAGSLSSAGMVGSNVNPRAPPLSDASTESKALIIDINEGISSSRPPSGFQPAQCGVPGKVSMADIVKMGKPHGKAPSNPYPSQQSGNHHHVVVAPPAAGSHDLCSSENYATMVSERNCELGVARGQHISPDDDWPLDEQPLAATVSSVTEPSINSGPHSDPSNLYYNMTNQQLNPQLDDVRFAEDASLDIPHADVVGAAPGSNRKIQEDYPVGTTVLDDDLYKNMSSYQVHQHGYDRQEVGDGGASVSSVATNFQQLSLSKEDEDSPSEAGSPAVKIPDHLQVQSADCCHLSFGSFGSGMSAPFCGPFTTRPVKSDLEEACAGTDALSVGHSDTRNHDYYDDEHIRSTSGGNIAHRLAASAGSYDMPSVPQTNALKREAPDELAQGNQYSFPSSAPNYSFEKTHQLSLLAHSQTTSQMQNLPILTTYPNSLANTLLASSVQSVREAELSYSAFPITQSMPTKYSSTISSISGPTISMTEAMKTGNLSSQPTQTLPGSSISGGTTVPQHLPVHPYSQPSLPLGHFANMISYPFMPQSYAYVPSAFQQTFAGNNTYHQSLAALLPQYKNSISVSSLPQSAAAASGYGAFGSSTGIPGNFPLNPPTAPAGTSIGYDDVLSSQYKDGNQMLSLQQNESLPLWVQGPGSRTMSAVPGSTYYSFQGQSQQSAGFRQTHQPSQHYGNLGYPNFYHSQSGLSVEHQQQISRDSTLGSSQGQPKLSQQLWQNSY